MLLLPKSNKMNLWTERLKIFEEEALQYAGRISVEDFVHSTYLSFKHQYFYGESPKTGCSTIKKVLIQAELGRRIDFGNPEFIHFREFNPFLKIQQVGALQHYFKREDIFKFCFVRNPYIRLLSCYLDKIKRDKYQSQQIKTQLGWAADAKRIVSFEEFVDVVTGQAVEDMDQHWRVQYDQTYQSNIEYDFIGRFENFEQDFRFILGHLGIDPEAYFDVEVSHATQASENLEAYYSPALAAKVYQKYQIDFEYFGYNKELELAG